MGRPVSETESTVVRDAVAREQSNPVVSVRVYNTGLRLFPRRILSANDANEHGRFTILALCQRWAVFAGCQSRVRPTPSRPRHPCAQLLQIAHHWNPTYDPRVIETPKLIWQVILNGIILNTRPQKSAKNYQKVWTDEGSPLLVILNKQKKLTQDLLGKENLELEFAVGMRYGNPSIEKGLEELREKNCNKIIVFIPQHQSIRHYFNGISE